MIDWHDTLASTNDHLKGLLEADPALPAGYVVAARTQTAGRGRARRVWVASAGENLTFSLLLRPACEPLQLASLPMAAALAVADLAAEQGVACSLKWPNDVLVGGRKLSGLLVEAMAGGAAILGVGLNVNMPPAVAGTIDQPATSFFMETGHPFELDPLLRRFLALFEPRYSVWLALGFAGLRDEWERWADRPGSRVSRGVVAGYGDHGELLVADAEGKVSPIWTAD